MNQYSQSSRSRLDTCHPDLQRLFEAVLQECDHTIISGYRGEEEQNQLFSQGLSQLKYPQSKHNTTILNSETGTYFPESRAVDVLPYCQNTKRMINGDQPEDILKILGFAAKVFQKACELRIGVRWGGNWRNFKDYPHWELI